LRCRKPRETGGKGDVIRVDQYEDIRKLWAVEGLSKREIDRRLGVSRNTVKRYSEGGRVPWERKKSQRKSPVITEEIIEFVRNCLEEDSKAPRKQRHTGHRIFKRLQEELGYEGAEFTIRRLGGQLLPSIVLSVSTVVIAFLKNCELVS